MAQAKKGDKVLVHYTGTYDDGTVFDSSVERGPLEVTIGTGMVIPGFDRALLDMEPGQKKTVNIPVDDAYGRRRRSDRDDRRSDRHHRHARRQPPDGWSRPELRT